MSQTEASGDVAADGHTDEASCLNCGTRLVGDHCHACGQRRHVHRTLGAFFHDMAHGVLHVEGRIWTTLPLLAWKPGELTRRYIDGERAKFVSPIALFLFSVFLLFAVASLSGSFAEFDAGEMRSELGQEIARQEAIVARLRQERDRVRRSGGPTAGLDAQIRAAEREAVAIRASTAVTDTDPEVNAPDWLRRPMERAASNPELLFYKLRTNAYKFSWMLIPLSVPFLWLLFPFSRRFRLYDHTVFVTYSLGFMTLLLVAAILVALAGLPQVAGFAALIPPFHMYRQLRGTYGLSRLGALARTVLLVTLAAVALGLFGVALLGLGLVD